MLERLKDLIANNFIAKKIQEKNNILLRSRKEVEINGNGTSGYTIKEGSHKGIVLGHKERKENYRIMDIIDYIKKKIIAPKVANLTQTTTSGVDSFEKYQYIVGQIKSLNDLQQELTDLQKKQELIDDDEEERGDTSS
jgi:hypothetical protein